MNREIKFRAWQKYHKTMLEVLNIGFKDGKVNSLKVEYPEDTIPRVVFYQKNDKKFWLDDDCIKLMQYTGLKDKNNKEIYEGDILKEENGDLDVCLYLEVVASYGFVPIEIYMYNYKEQGESINELSLVEEMYKEYDIQCFPRNLTARDYLEVIGNIYENPELLKGR